MFPRSLGRLLLPLFVCLLATPAEAQLSFEGPPIDYLTTDPDDAVSRLQQKIDDGAATLEYEPGHGYLKSVLQHLGVSQSTQGLVFSKTSFQLRRISPRSPRAIYFADDVYVGWVAGGDVMEVSAVDPDLGGTYYTLAQRESDPPKFTRHTHTCLQCHGSTLTRGVPGHLVRSVYPKPDGQPILSTKTYLSDHTSPLKERWGGWYVTGTHGRQRHLGNLMLRESDDPQRVNTDRGANVTDLADRFDTHAYLSGHSDIVALMVLEHQVNMHNLIARANYQTRIALRDEKVMNEMLERPADHRSESTTRRIRGAGEPLVEYLLFSGETKLTDRVEGTSGFTRQFQSQGPFDEQGRSLREFDLSGRMFKYPCSYLIYSEAFDHLPTPVKKYVYRRLWEVLSGEDRSEEFRHLQAKDRRAILEILRDTKAGLSDDWEVAGRLEGKPKQRG